MYNTDDTIVAVSSGLTGRRKIIRISGPETFDYFSALLDSKEGFRRGVRRVNMGIGDLFLFAQLYIFPGPNSYTGDDLIEIHIDANTEIIETLIADFTRKNLRLAEPGEFTARAFLNGKMDLAQAEAVAEIVTAGNIIKLNAAHKLLAGRLSKNIGKIRTQLLEVMSQIEAGLDFSDQDIQLNAKEQLVNQTDQIQHQLNNLLEGCIHYESMIDLPGIAITGAPNAGKSSLLNAVLGWERSIVSGERATTRDILTGELELENNKCIIFDCAGLISHELGIIDELAQQAAIEAVKKSAVVLFCIEAVKDDYSEDVAAMELIHKNFNGPLLCVITKSDMLESENAENTLNKLNIAQDAIFVSSKKPEGIDKLKTRIDQMLGQTIFSAGETSDSIAINQRHTETVKQSSGNIKKATLEIESGREELAAMFLRNAYETLAGIENEQIDEQMLERIFSHFCIGK